jgi:hypothetical protein
MQKEHTNLCVDLPILKFEAIISWCYRGGNHKTE